MLGPLLDDMVRTGGRPIELNAFQRPETPSKTAGMLPTPGVDEMICFTGQAPVLVKKKRPQLNFVLHTNVQHFQREVTFSSRRHQTSVVAAQCCTRRECR